VHGPPRQKLVVVPMITPGPRILESTQCRDVTHRSRTPQSTHWPASCRSTRKKNTNRNQCEAFATRARLQQTSHGYIHTNAYSDQPLYILMREMRNAHAARAPARRRSRIRQRDYCAHVGTCHSSLEGQSNSDITTTATCTTRCNERAKHARFEALINCAELN
jgi:hypothetical protein